MKVLGLITEYNPFHNGHKYHLDQSKLQTNSTHTIAVMSGNFLQRGEPAFLNKWLRAEMAVKQGVDLVIELPVVYACSSAEFFAFGAISLLHKLNIVDSISFGSEEGDIKNLSQIAQILVEEPPDYKKALKQFLESGLPFAMARQQALFKHLDSEATAKVLESPNNILGIEYIKSLLKLNSMIHPFTIKRIKADYHSLDIKGSICSATAIRSYLSRNPSELNDLESVMPDTSFEVLQNAIREGLGPVTQSDFDQIFLYKLRISSKNSIKKLMDVNEGLENRIKNASYSAYSYRNFLDTVQTKRYTLTRLQRITIHSLLGIKAKHISYFNQIGGTQYARILAFSSKGQEILKELKHKSSIPIIININKTFLESKSAQKMLSFDISATDLYSLGYPNIHRRTGAQDYYQTPYIHA